MDESKYHRCVHVVRRMIWPITSVVTPKSLLNLEYLIFSVSYRRRISTTCLSDRVAR